MVYDRISYRRAKAPSVGDMRDVVTIQKPVRTADGMGGYTESWQDVARVNAVIMPLKTYELALAAQLKQNHTHRVVIRYRSDVKRGYRVAVGNKAEQTRMFYVETVMEIDNRRRFLILECREYTE